MQCLLPKRPSDREPQCKGISQLNWATGHFTETGRLVTGIVIHVEVHEKANNTS